MRPGASLPLAPRRRPHRPRSRALAAAGCEGWPDTAPAAAAALVQAEIARWTPIAAAMNLHPG